MKFLLTITFFSCLLLFSCKKDRYINSPDARISIAIDTLRFDTVFTSIGSVTKYFTLVNNNEQKIRISEIKLSGGQTSPFKINVDGRAGTRFNQIDLDANDSVYLFVNVTIDPNNSNNPFVVNDSIVINYNGNTRKVQLQAFGQQAHFIKNQTITNNVTWNKELPYVIQNNLNIAPGATLTIEKGARIFVNANAAFMVNGTLKIRGEKEEQDRVIFRGERLDEAYRDLPGGWPGIVFTGTSKANEMSYTHILNAYQAVVVAGGAGQNQPQLTMNQCLIHNAYDVGLYTINSSVTASNCLFSQCGNNGLPGEGGSNLLVTGGGKYNINHCTIVTYAGFYQNHKQASCYISNKTGNMTALLDVNCSNSIIDGMGSSVDDELVVNHSPGDVVNFSNVLYKRKNKDPVGVTFTDCIRNKEPLFDSISTNRQTYNFRLRDVSPAIDAGKLSGVVIDLDGKPRPVGLKPDLGCYEKQ